MSDRVSVIMPVLNGERFIAEAIQSVADQTYTNLELVVVDDGSTDRTGELVRRFRDKLDIQCVRHEVPQGIPRSMNDGIRHGTGELISFLDHDDAWFPAFLETQTRYLREHSDVAMVHSDFQTIDVDGRVLEESVSAARGRPRPSGRVFPQLFMESFIVGNSVLIRRECFTQLGMFDESLKWGDYLMWMRIARHYQVDYVDAVLTKYRQHPTQSTRDLATEPTAHVPTAVQAIERLLELHPEVREELGDRVIRHRLAASYFDQAYRWFRQGDGRNVRAYLNRALRLWPTNGRYLALYAASTLGPAQRRTARQIWRRLTGGGLDPTENAGGITV
jgi:glycosyltransferase involved in cell wall biosynthesis